jgi:GNAT superfamily N-acetyltransferase
MSLAPLPPGYVGTIVTSLEHDGPPPAVPVPASPLTMTRCEEIDLARYRALFARVGGPWLWYSRLAMDDAALARAIGEVHVVDAPGDPDCGFVEFDFAERGICAIRFLGLAPALAGQGHGRWLFAETLARGFRPGVRRIKVHTCSLDHPAALPAYLRAGFRAVRRAVESFPDPRLAGLLPRDCAPQVPLIR